MHYNIEDHLAIYTISNQYRLEKSTTLQCTTMWSGTWLSHYRTDKSGDSSGIVHLTFTSYVLFDHSARLVF
ncbi:hypothetical protein ACN42_g4290 [Penicillium freii]|uniref:Uncharacterized protein n=1 Tax=Penicillium freii TaxID=48697 RepID=A0A101MLM0_PENFR|nr:hypothetical protein ACN42_g4290 [Penicillium freii]